MTCAASGVGRSPLGPPLKGACPAEEPLRDGGQLVTRQSSGAPVVVGSLQRHGSVGTTLDPRLGRLSARHVGGRARRERLPDREISKRMSNARDDEFSDFVVEHESHLLRTRLPANSRPRATPNTCSGGAGQGLPALVAGPRRGPSTGLRAQADGEQHLSWRRRLMSPEEAVKLIPDPAEGDFQTSHAVGDEVRRALATRVAAGARRPRPALLRRPHQTPDRRNPRLARSAP